MTIDLTLSARRGDWSMPVRHGIPTSPQGRVLRDRILKRDRDTCQGADCGSRSRHHMELHHISGDHDDQHDGNLATLCPWCHLVFHLPTATHLRSGDIVWLPQVPQGVVSRISILCHIALADTAHPWHAMARQIESEMATRADLAAAELDIRDPERLAEAIIRWTEGTWRSDPNRPAPPIPESEVRRRLWGLRLWIRHIPGSSLSNAAQFFKVVWPSPGTPPAFDLQAVINAVAPRRTHETPTSANTLSS